jgi:hypothetical protein
LVFLPSKITALESKWLDIVANAFNSEVPHADAMDDLIDKMIPLIRPHSEDLREVQFYVGKHWVEVRDDENFHELILHIFNADEEYLLSDDGAVWFGKWRFLANKLIFGKLDPDEEDPTGEAFELVFLDPEFFILKKLSNPLKFENNRKYFVLAAEHLARKLEWFELMQYLFNKYRNNNNFLIVIVLVVLLIFAIVMALS